MKNKKVEYKAHKFLWKISDTVRDIIKNIMFWGWVFHRENKKTFQISFKERLNANFKSYLSETYYYYFKSGKSFPKKDYITDYQRHITFPKVNFRYGILLADKMLFYEFMQFYKEYIPKIYGEIRKGKVYPLHINKKFNSIEEIFITLRKDKSLVIKPKSGYGGKGVMICKFINQQIFVNDKITTATVLESEIKKLDNYIIMKFVEQANYSKKIFEHSTNTIRLITIYDNKKEEAFIVGASHRFGVESSRPVDNISSGGLTTAIDIQTGILGESGIFPKGKDARIQWLEKHPDSETMIKGMKIKNWEFIKSKILEIAKYTHYTPYVGWDIVSTEESFYILEGNDATGVNFLQVHQPLLQNEKTRNFFNLK